jgi:DNA-binding MarR family transcriptional regulator
MDVVSGTGIGGSGLRKPTVIAWLRLARVYHKVDRASAERLSAYGLSVGQFDVLAQVGAHEGITQKELAERLLVTKSNVCQIVRRMEERGLVSRRQEGRAKRLFLTEEGHRLFEEVVPSQEELIDRLLSCVPSEDHDPLSKTLGRLDWRCNRTPFFAWIIYRLTNKGCIRMCRVG